MSLATPIHVSPFTVAIDNREGAPYRFHGITTDKSLGSRQLLVPTHTTCLETGDYSILGLESHLAIERKSKEDAYQTFGRNRQRFERELERLAEMKFAAVVIEADYNELAFLPPRHTKTTGKTVLRSIIAWQQRYPVAFVCAPGRGWAERLTWRHLERFWRDHPELHQTAIDLSEAAAKERINDGERLPGSKP